MNQFCLFEKTSLLEKGKWKAFVHRIWETDGRSVRGSVATLAHYIVLVEGDMYIIPKLAPQTPERQKQAAIFPIHRLPVHNRFMSLNTTLNCKEARFAETLLAGATSDDWHQKILGAKS